MTVGAGCRIGDLLPQLARNGLTLPSIGLIDRQTLAGAVATATHGSGGALHVALCGCAADRLLRAGGAAVVRTVDSAGPGIAGRHDPDLVLRAARCAVGALGVVLELTLRCAYTEPRELFERVARLIATVLARAHGARLHWGKWFPLGGSDVERMCTRDCRRSDRCATTSTLGEYSAMPS